MAPPQSAPHNPNLGYMPQLDTIRFGAVFLVLLQHVAGLMFLPFGHWGVSLFFVLSGFLITGILLGSREKIDSGRLSKRDAMLQFYWRRACRIFPLYYAVVLLFAIALNIEHGRQYWQSLLFYAMNWSISLSHFEAPIWSVFWSLAVEEHFYLLWPAIILLAPKRLRLLATLALIASGPAWRMASLRYGWNDVALYKMDFACFDSLGLGALLAQVHRSTRWRTIGLKLLDWILLPASLVSTLGLLALVKLEINWSFDIVLSDLTMGIVFCWLVSRASVGFQSWIGGFLSLRSLTYCGKITYGVYVYHLLVMAGFAYWLGSGNPSWRTFAIVTPLTIAVSALSWEFFEMRFNRLKDRFTFGARAPHGGTRSPVPPNNALYRPFSTKSG
jgi:peptidoglycan/LPS O-acetylase OafA/YrhL